MREMISSIALVASLLGCGGTEPPRPSVPPTNPTAVCGIERSTREPSLMTFTSDEAKACEMACNHGDDGSCVTLGMAYEFGRGVWLDAEKSVELYHRACEHEYVRGCSHEAASMLGGFGIDYDPEQAIKIATGTCLQGDARGCWVLSTAAYKGIGMSQDFVASAAWSRRACDTGFAEGCGNLAVAHGEGNGVATNPIAATTIATKACTLGSPVGCQLAGLVQIQIELQSASPDQRIISEGIELIERACRQSVFGACIQLASMYAGITGSEKIVVPKDMARAAELLVNGAYRQDQATGKALLTLDVSGRSSLETSCIEKNDARACVVASRWYAADKTMPTAKQKAAELAAHACDPLKDPQGCVLHAMHNGDDNGSAETIAKRRALYADACTHGEPTGCEGLVRLFLEANPKLDDIAQMNAIVKDPGGIIRRGCHLGSISLCGLRGASYLHGEPTPQDRAASFRLLDRSCQFEDAYSCARLASFYFQGLAPATKNSAKGAALLDKACEGNVTSVCLEAGVHYLDGQDVVRDDEKGFGFVKKACDAHEPWACDVVTILSAIGRGTEKDEKNGPANLRDLCKKDNKAACFFLGTLSIDEPQAMTEARDSFQKACSLGHSHGCHVLGLMNQYGVGTAPDPAKALLKYAEACTMDHAESCFLAGRMHLQGQGVPVSAVVAVDFQKRACAGQDMAGCHALAELYEQGRGVPRQHEEAVKKYETACAGDYGPACRRLGEMYLDGIGLTKKDPALGVQKLEKACQLGDTDAIPKLLKLRSDGWVAPMRLVATLDIACNQGAWPACRSLAFLLWDPPPGNIIERNQMAAFERARASCEHNDLPACGLLARIYETGVARTQTHAAIVADKKQAQAFFEKGCANGSSFSTSIAANVLFSKEKGEMRLASQGETERGFDPASCFALSRYDKHRAREWIEMACRAKHGPACQTLGKMRETENVEDAAVAYQIACDEDIADACSALGALIRKGKLSQTNTSRQVLTDACARRIATACTELQRK